MNWYLASPDHWISCSIVRKLIGGLVIFRLYNDPPEQKRQGRARPGLYGLLIEAAK